MRTRTSKKLARLAARRRSKLNTFKVKIASESEDLVAKLEQQTQKMSKVISELTGLLSVAHTAFVLDDKTHPVLKNVYKALNSLISAKSTLTTAKLYLQKVKGVDRMKSSEEEEE